MVERNEPWAPGTPCWVDLMTTDEAAGRAFYGELFRWDIEVGPPETGGYSMASVRGRTVAGIGAMMGMDHPSVWNTYLATVDVDATAKAVEAAGGAIIAAPMDVMEYGRMAHVSAPGGGAFGLWQAGTNNGMELANETGSVIWTEFMTRDFPAACSFFAEVFGYTYTDFGAGSFVYSTIEIDGNTVGGIGELAPDVPAHIPPHWRVYFAVENADATMDQVVALGGTVLTPARDMPYGRHGDVADPQGAPLTIMQPAPFPTE